jgi:hypothetical protein
VTFTKAISSLKVFCHARLPKLTDLNEIVRCCCDCKYLASPHYLRNEFLNDKILYYRAITRDEKKYPCPNEFKPERFLLEDGSLTDDDMHLAFGWGRRIW